MSIRTAYNRLLGGLLGTAFVAALAVLLFERHNPITAALVAAGWSLTTTGLAVSLAQLIIPGRLIYWREQLLATRSSSAMAPLGAAVSRHLHISGAESRRDRSAVRRVRVMGLVFLILFGAIADALLWLPAFVDTWFVPQ